MLLFTKWSLFISWPTTRVRKERRNSRKIATTMRLRPWSSSGKATSRRNKWTSSKRAAFSMKKVTKITLFSDGKKQNPTTDVYTIYNKSPKVSILKYFVSSSLRFLMLRYKICSDTTGGWKRLRRCFSLTCFSHHG